MASYDRIDRISEEVHKAIDRIIRDEVNDPRVGGTWSIVRCEVTRDLRYAKVRVSILEAERRKDMMAALNRAAGFIRRELGHATVRSPFKVSGVGTVAGSYVTDGKIIRSQQVRLLRDNVVSHEGKISSLQRFKDAVKEVNTGYECGIGIENYNDIKENDVIECFMMEEVEQ